MGKVQGIPSVVILDGDGGLITKDGRQAISGDPCGLKMPWTPPTKAEKQQMMLDCLGPKLLGQTKGKPIGLYFSTLVSTMPGLHTQIGGDVQRWLEGQNGDHLCFF